MNSSHLIAPIYKSLPVEKIQGDIATIEEIKSSNSLVLVPDGFLREINRFISRNSFTVQNTEKRFICLRCLKAYLRSRMDHHNFSFEMQRLLLGKIKCEMGHEAYYYIDNGFLKKIS